MAKEPLTDVSTETKVGVEVQREQISLVEICQLPLGKVDLVELRPIAVGEFLADKDYAIKNVESVASVPIPTKPIAIPI